VLAGAVGLTRRSFAKEDDGQEEKTAFLPINEPLKKSY